MSVNLNGRSYKELQEIAKRCSIPANVKRGVLVGAINAYYENDRKLCESIINDGRAKKKKPKISVRPKPKRKAKNKNSPSGDESDYNVDSTSGSMKDVIPGNHFLQLSQESNAFDDPNKFLDRLYSRQHSAFVLDNAQYGSGLDYSIASSLSSNQLQSNFVSPSSALMPYSAVLPKDTRQNFPEYNSNYPTYHTNAFYRQSCAPFSWMETQSPFFSIHDGFYAAQLPASKLFEPKIVPLDTASFSRDQPRSCSVAKSGFFGTEPNGMPSMEVDCPADLLPNVPQLEANVESQVNVSSSWTQNIGVPTFSDRVELSPVPTHSYQENACCDEGRVLLIADNESVNAEVDSASDADNHSLSNDIVNLLDLNNMEKESVMDSRLLMSSEFSQGGQSSSAVSSEHSEYVPNNPDYRADENSSAHFRAKTTSWSDSTVSNVEQVNSTFESSTFQTCLENVGYQLPSFSTLMQESQQATVNSNDAGAGTDYQAAYQQPHDLSFPNCSQQNVNSVTNNCPPCCTQPAGYDCIDGSTAARNESILRHRLMDTNFPYRCHQTPNNSVLITLDSLPKSQPLSKSAPSSTFNFSQLSIATENTSENADHQRCDEVEALEVRHNNYETSHSISKTNAYSQTPETGRLIYEKETLHRSKIVCDAAKNGVKENIVSLHEFFKFIIPNESNDLVSNQSTTRKKVSDIFPSPLSGFLKSPYGTSIRACMYKSSGCAFEAKSDATLVHEKKCKFQLIYCPSERCPWKESMHSLSQHIKDCHETDTLHRQQFLYTIDRIANDHDLSFHTFYQIHNNTIYVIRLHIDEDKCIATVQYIPEIQDGLFKIKNVKGVMEFICFPDKRRVKSWKGFIQPYSDSVNKCQKYNTIQIDVNGSEFIALYVFINC